MNRFVCGAVLSCCVLSAYSQQREEFTDERVKQTTATIEAVNQEDRSIVLRGNDNSRVLVVAGPEVRNFDRINVGDRVSARYREAVAVEVLPRGSQAQDPKAATVVKRAPEGERPGVGVANMITTTVTIESVDTSFDTVTFKRPDGIVRTVAVDNPKAREFIRGLRRGNEVQITYSEALAVELQAAN
jgi:hypothetical protein